MVEDCPQDGHKPDTLRYSALEHCFRRSVKTIPLSVLILAENTIMKTNELFYLFFVCSGEDIKFETEGCSPFR